MYESNFLLFCPNFADVAKPPILAEPMVNGSSARISWSHTDKGLCFHNLTFSYNITWYPVKGGETQSNTTWPGATEYIITNLMRNSGYRVGLVGFTLSEPPVYSETAVVNFTTKGMIHMYRSTGYFIFTMIAVCECAFWVHVCDLNCIVHSVCLVLFLLFSYLAS